MDELVQRAQRFVNTQYANGATLGIAKLDEDGRTSWSVMYALTRALQYELGISPLSNSFGPTTLSTLTARYPRLDASTMPSAIMCRIIQSALYCKGYDGGDIDGIYNDRVAASVSLLKSRMGLGTSLPGSSLEPKVVKALLTMDAYVVVGSGTETIRSIQQWLNGRYVNRRDFFVMPCDGSHSRDVAKAMLFAIQYELGMADGTANGVFGPGTQSGLRGKVLSVGATGVWPRLFTAGMILNARSVPFGDFTATVESGVRTFQSFSMLPVTGKADFPTWASLLVSYGDQSRPGTACDGVTKITPARATTLVNAGYRYVGRYLSGATSSTSLPEKPIQPGELETIRQYGLRCFPIYQTWSRSASYFSYEQGTSDAYSAIEWARFHGFKPGTTIYFAVDYDAVDAEVTSYVLPHFRGIRDVIAESSGYRVGMYGPRNACQRVADAGYAVTSFVSDMSSGFSGNLGYPLPTNWAFDQIVTTTVGSGDGFIEIDKNIASGRDLGQNDFAPSQYTVGLDGNFDGARYGAALLADVKAYMESIGVPETGGDEWNDDDWATLRGISTSRAVELVLSADWLFTSVARQLLIRKALVQTAVLWELRKFNPLDIAADDAVKAGLRDDCTTGWGQIYSWVAIEARNYCVRQGIISGPILVLDTDRRLVWDRLHDDLTYNIRTAAYLTVYNGYQVDQEQGTSIGRPDLQTTHAETQKLLARYRGTGVEAVQHGEELIGLYDVLERYNLLCRS